MREAGKPGRKTNEVLHHFPLAGEPACVGPRIRKIGARMKPERSKVHEWSTSQSDAEPHSIGRGMREPERREAPRFLLREPVEDVDELVQLLLALAVAF